jgi:hypothetical protein
MMKKSILQLGTVLERNQQRQIHGGSYNQIDCEMDGGRWVCIGSPGNPLGACGCVFDHDGEPPNNKK